MILEYRKFVITYADTLYSFPLDSNTFVFRDLQRAKDAIDRYYALKLLPCEIYSGDGDTIDGERGGRWMG